MRCHKCRHLIWNDNKGEITYIFCSKECLGTYLKDLGVSDSNIKKELDKWLD